MNDITVTFTDEERWAIVEAIDQAGEQANAYIACGGMDEEEAEEHINLWRNLNTVYAKLLQRVEP